MSIKNINNSRLLLYIILFLSVLLRLHNLNESVWFDEVMYGGRVILKDLASLVRVILFDTPGPFFRIFMFFWIGIFGDSEIPIRMPSFILGVLSIGLVYTIVSRFGKNKTAVLASFLMCVSPVHIWYSQEAAPYSTLTFLFLTALFSYYRLTETPAGPIWYAVYFISFFFAVFTHYIAFSYLILLSLFCAVKIEPCPPTGAFPKITLLRVSSIDKVERNILLMHLFIFASLVLFLMLKIKFGVIYAGVGYMRPFTFFELWKLFFNWFTFGNSIWNIHPYFMHLDTVLHRPLMACAQILFFIIFVRGLIMYFKESNCSYGIKVILCLFFPAVFMMGASLIGFKRTYIERFLFIILPFFYMVLANGVAGFKNNFLKIACILVVIAFSITALISFFIKGNEWTAYKQNPDWRSAVQYFRSEEEKTKGPLIKFVTIQPLELDYYEYRFRKQPAPYIYRWQRNEPDYIYRTVSSNGVTEFYLIKNIYWEGGFANLLKCVISDSKVIRVDKKTFKGLEIYKFRVVK